MPQRLPRPARRALGGIRLAIAGSVAVTGLATGPGSGGPGSAYAGHLADDPPDPVRRVLERHDCSTSGFADATPSSAVISTAHGRLRHVSFDRGWEVYTRHGDAQLVAVCRAAPGRTSRPG